MAKVTMTRWLGAALMTVVLTASAQELDLSTIGEGEDDALTTQMGETQGGDLKVFTVVSDDALGTLEVGDIYKNNSSFFKVTKVSSKGKKGGKFRVQRTSGSNDPTRTWTRVSGLGPITVSSRETLWTLYLAGGGIMHPIAFCMVVVIVIGINGFFVFRRSIHCPPRFMEEASARLHQGDLAGFRGLCAGERGLLGHICRAMVDDSAGADVMTVEDMHARCEMQANKQINHLKIPLKTLNVIAAVTPMLGLLGTVMGMVKCFESIAFESASASKALALAAGIRVALFTTVAGLFVAIPALLIMFLFNQKLSGMTSDCEIMSNTFVTLIGKITGVKGERTR